MTPSFACDVMLGGLARWLRAAGYDASWFSTISDPDLVRYAQTEGRILLSSDGDPFEFTLLRDGIIPSLFVPRGLTIQKQLEHVLHHFSLPLLFPRCMTCGGRLLDVEKESIRDEVPPRSFRWMEQFWRCDRCGKVFWQGTHWIKIAERLSAAAIVEDREA